LDYDLARVKDVPVDPETRRFYEPHENLVNPETGETAELSLFWDQVFKPGCAAGCHEVPAQHHFFESREEAAQHEPDLPKGSQA
jgi:hypothetical protein